MRIEEEEMKIDLEIMVRIEKETKIEDSKVKELESLNGEKILLLLKVCWFTVYMKLMYNFSSYPMGRIPGCSG